MFFGDPTFLLLIPVLLLAFYAQARVKGAYQKYSQVTASSKISGARAASMLLQAAGAGDVKIEKIPGMNLSDHYDPRKRVLRLSEGVHDSPSVAALGIAAHEAGHAIQHQTHYQPLHLRTAIYPVANIGSMLAFPLFLAGFFFGHGSKTLMDIGILLFSGAVAFSVITLPVEFNASRRALALLEERRFLTPAEMDGARAVLKAAALTYVAATAMAAVQLLRLFLLRDSRD